MGKTRHDIFVGKLYEVTGNSMTDNSFYLNTVVEIEQDLGDGYYFVRSQYGNKQHTGEVHESELERYINLDKHLISNIHAVAPEIYPETTRPHFKVQEEFKGYIKENDLYENDIFDSFLKYLKTTNQYKG